MKFYVKGKKVSKKAAKEYMENTWGKGSFERRLEEAKRYFMEECDNVCSWMDFEIER